MQENTSFWAIDVFKIGVQKIEENPDKNSRNGGHELSFGTKVPIYKYQLSRRNQGEQIYLTIVPMGNVIQTIADKTLGTLFIFH